jgi:hypothetical protein
MSHGIESTKLLYTGRKSCRGTSVTEARYTPQGLEVINLSLLCHEGLYTSMFLPFRMTEYGLSCQSKHTKFSLPGMSPRFVELHPP